MWQFLAMAAWYEDAVWTGRWQGFVAGAVAGLLLFVAVFGPALLEHYGIIGWRDAADRWAKRP